MNGTTSTPTLTQRLAWLRLSETDDVQVRYPPHFGRIEIWADTVEVHGWVRLHGRDVHLHARRIVARPVDGRPPVIDVSGAPAAPDFDPTAPSSRPQGTAQAPDGSAGRDGGAGQDGGRIDVAVDEIDGALGLAANGSRGAHSERGSDGVKPLTVNGVDAVFKPANWPSSGPHGGGVLQKRGLQKYVAWAAGQRGGDARQGGAAGAPGRPGDGGQGGQVRVRYSGPDRPTLATIADGGAAGEAGAPARPGPAGTAGAGGRNRIYYYEWSKGHNEFARSSKNKTIDKLARQYKINARANAGSGGAVQGTVPDAPVAMPGAAGAVTVAPMAMADAAAGFDLPFLQLVLALAQQDLSAGRTANALQRHRWLVRVTSPMADAAAAQIHQAAAAACATLTKGQSPA